MSNFREKLFDLRYNLLLLSFLLLIFLPLFFPDDFYQDNMQPLVFGINLIAGINLFYHRKKIMRYLMIFLGLAFLIVGLNFFKVFSSESYIFSLYLIFFAIVAFQLFRDILQADHIEPSILIAVLCGFVVLGLTGFFIFLLIEIYQPGSFNNLNGTLAEKSTDLLYFSYVTQTTIGYGDITPSNEFSKRVVMLFGLACQIYQTIIVALIIGKYLNQESKK